ncbi:hypothetical protein TWF718_004986 [Orbilia javanica]|uniref:Uncharacterized protein n=1 Tax=Orbilia javanica TaxID=47235 RepID=A0AAN8NCQ7_9PEZI
MTMVMGMKKATRDDKSEVKAVKFSSDSKVLATASYENTVRLWDIATGALLQTIDREDINLSLLQNR